MSYPNNEERPYTSYYPRPPGSSGGPADAHPDRLHSSHGYPKPQPASPAFHHDMPAPPGTSHGYPSQAPMTPITGNTYPPPPPPSSGYYGLASNASEHMPSPPPTGDGRPGEQTLTFTPEGAPIVPVGVSGGKMFRCRGFGECDKVFTRSEHLARHVRKHTGERPFPCHCGKAFSRLDNLRQHAATVHADHAALNEAMLNSLAPVHANLSQKAGREQRKRGEIVEVPKNAVERPRHNEYRTGRGDTQQSGQATPGEFGEFGAGWDERPRTGYTQPYPYAEQGQVQDNGGPSRRPPSGGYAYPYGYDQNRPPTGGAPPSDAGQHVPYPYRPMSASGRELPVPQHYAESEPPVSAHGPPQSPMYPPAAPGPWSSSPTHANAYPHHEGAYPPHAPTEGYYEHSTPAQQHYGPPPPGSSGASYAYPPSASGYYPPGQGSTAPAPQPPSQYAQYPYPGNPSETPFQYSGSDQAQYPYGSYDRKRRAEGDNDDSRKMPRPASAIPANLNDAIRETAPPSGSNANANAQASEPLWLPPTTERRSSLAISALLGSPQQSHRELPAAPEAPGGATYPPQPYPYHAPTQERESAASSVSATPADDEPKKEEN